MNTELRQVTRDCGNIKPMPPLNKKQFGSKRATATLIDGGASEENRSGLDRGNGIR
jgi:hypothetical protein